MAVRSVRQLRNLLQNRTQIADRKLDVSDIETGRPETQNNSRKCDRAVGMLQVGDQSEFVNVFSKVVGQVGPRIGAALTTNYFRFFCDKLANSFTPRFYEYIFR